ncbi:zinc finger and SCAN domain-containing protein 2-like [Acipenser ruthenus]|uniref:zinc finger and SCAN domain-containing protein 2-like n=1 Tax=Acipenser ruthenus TaxID=7906 RepID=UPI0027405ED8|nr:zinc finger and SCAN domain-containing protein 2-like [Acipenser ruthenus]
MRRVRSGRTEGSKAPIRWVVREDMTIQIKEEETELQCDQERPQGSQPPQFHTQDGRSQPPQLHTQDGRSHQRACHTQDGRLDTAAGLKVNEITAGESTDEEERTPSSITVTLDESEAEELCFPCPHCKISFTGAQYLNKHIKNSHREHFTLILRARSDNVETRPSCSSPAPSSSSPPLHRCGECGKTFHHSGDFKRHVRSHTGEAPYPCPDCGKRFTNSGNLKTHRLVHTGETPFQCPQCGRSFGLLGNLKIHQRIHTGETPFQCPQCGRSFRESGKLGIHLRSHSGEAPYRCSDCGKTFSLLGNLKIHQRLHTGEMPYLCAACGKRFTYSYQLRTHACTLKCIPSTPALF